jgi:hypothetical protein
VNADTHRFFKISFVIWRDGSIHSVRTTTLDRCQNGSQLQVTQQAFSFDTVLAKSKRGPFRFTLHAGPRDQPATLRGVIRGTTVTGTLTDRSPDPSGVGICQASTRWSAAQ